VASIWFFILQFKEINVSYSQALSMTSPFKLPKQRTDRREIRYNLTIFHFVITKTTLLMNLLQSVLTAQWMREHKQLVSCYSLLFSVAAMMHENKFENPLS